METQSSLLCSQKLAIGPYPEPAVPIFSLKPRFSHTYCNINLHPNSVFQEVFSHWVFLITISFAIITSSMHATFPTLCTFMHK
jgi:hypothetical protein